MYEDQVPVAGIQPRPQRRTRGRGTIIRAGLHWQGKGTLVEQLVGLSVDSAGRGCIYTILERSDPPLSALKRTRKELQGLYASQRPGLDLQVEKAFQHEYIQRFFTDDGKGNGRLILRRGFLLLSGNPWDILVRLLTFRLPDRKTVVWRIDTFFDALQRFSRLEPASMDYEERSQAIRQLSESCTMLRMVAPACEQLIQQYWRHHTAQTAMIAIIAIMEYQREHGLYPSDLDQLVEAGHLEAKPIDPYSGKPFLYRQTADGFLLYSVGQDRKDDGGVRGTDEHGRPIVWAEDGDWVFWPWLYH